MYDFDRPFTDSRTGKTPRIPAGNDVLLQGLLKKPQVGGTVDIADVSTISTITAEIQAVERTGAPFARKSLGSSDLDNAVTQETWDDGSAQHFSIAFTPLDTELEGTVVGKEYYLVLYATLATGEAVTLAQTRFFVIRDNVPDDGTQPVQAGNLIPGGATYDGSGHYTLSGLTAGKALRWLKGSHDTSLTNGASTVSTSGQNFFAAGTSVTLNGTAGQTVTAAVWNAVWMTADEVQAYVASLSGTIAGTYSGTGSPEGVVSAVPGNTYFDKTSGAEHFWIKKTGTGNTGWFQII